LRLDARERVEESAKAAKGEAEEEGEGEGRVARDLRCWTRDTRTKLKEGDSSEATNI